MGLFRKVHISFWSDPYIASLSIEERYCFLYLLTNEKTTACGVYETVHSRMCTDLKFTSPQLKKILDKFVKEKKIVISERTGEIGLLNWRKYNHNRSPKLQILVNRQIASVKDKSLIEALLNGREFIPDASGEEEEEPPAATQPLNIAFSDFRTLYARTTGDMKRAERLWNQLKAEEREAVMAHVPLFKIAQPDKKFRPHPATYLYQRRWENEIVSDNPSTSPPSKHKNEW